MPDLRYSSCVKNSDNALNKCAQFEVIPCALRLFEVSIKRGRRLRRFSTSLQAEIVNFPGCGFRSSEYSNPVLKETSLLQCCVRVGSDELPQAGNCSINDL